MRREREPLERPLGHRDRRHAGRRGEALLGARVGEVHAPGAHLERHAGERGHAVGHQEGVAVAQRRAQLRERVLDAGGGLRVHHGHHASAGVAVELLYERVVRDALPPVSIDRHHLGAVTARDLRDAPSEEAALRHDHGVAGLEQVRYPGLHPGRAGAVQRQDEPVRHAVDAPQHRDDVEQDVVQVGVEVAEHRPAHRVEHRRVHVRRAGAAQKSLRRLELGEVHVPQGGATAP